MSSDQAVDTTIGLGGSAVAGVEASLDVEYIEAVAAPIPLTVYNSLQYSIFDWAESLNNDESPSWVQSVSTTLSPHLPTKQKNQSTT